MSAPTRIPDGGWWRGRRFFRTEPARDVDEELAFHLEMRVAEYVASGMTPEEARAEAARRFGDLRVIRDECRTLAERRARGASRDEWWQGWLRDLQVAARGLRRRPGLTAGAALTLALAISVATTVFAVADAFLLRPYPSPVGPRLVVVAQTSRLNEIPGNISYGTYRDLLAERAVFEDGVAWMGETVATRGGGGEAAERRFAQFVTGNVFAMLRAPMALGRGFTAEEDRARAPVIVLAHRLWQSRFGADSAVVGRAVHLAGVPFTVVGVTAPDFAGTSGVVAPDLFAPLGAITLIRPSAAALFEERKYNTLKVWMVRRPGVTMAQVERVAGEVGRRVNADPSIRGTEMRLVTRAESRARPDIAIAANVPVIVALFGAMAMLVLLAASVNVAGLALARAQTRRGELALRRALGASSGRLGRLVAMESVLLGALALGPGLLLATWMARRLGGIRLAVDLPIRVNIEPGWRTFAAAVVVSLGVGLMAGLAPAWRAGRTAPADALRDEGRGGTGGRARARLRVTLVVAQLAASLVLLVSAALFVRSLRGASAVDPGFRIDHQLLASTDVSLLGYDSLRTRRFYEQLLEHVRALPGVRSAGLATVVPQGYEHSSTDVYVDAARPGGADHHEILFGRVSPDYFDAIGIALRTGRSFAPGDSVGAPLVAVLSEAAARLLAPDGAALGRQFRLERGGPPVQVVGIVRDAKRIFLNEPDRPFVYLPLGQGWRGSLTLHVRTSIEPASLAAPVRDVFRALDPALPVFDVRTMEEHLGGGISLVLVRLAAAAATGLGLLGLVLTIVGVYGVVSYGVVERTREFGVRMALGAGRRDLLARVLRDGLVLLLVGTIIGAVVAFGLTRAMAGLLIGVGARDVVAYAGALAVLAVSVLLATWLPARRAARLQPVEALRA